MMVLGSTYVKTQNYLEIRSHPTCASQESIEINIEGSCFLFAHNLRIVCSVTIAY